MTGRFRAATISAGRSSATRHHSVHRPYPQPLVEDTPPTLSPCRRCIGTRVSAHVARRATSGGDNDDITAATGRGSIGEAGARRRPGGRAVMTGGCQAPLLAAIDQRGTDPIVATRECRHEGESGAIGRPRRLRQRHLPGVECRGRLAIAIDDEEAGLPIAVGREREMATIRRPGRPVIPARAMRDAPELCPIARDDVDLPVAAPIGGEGEPATIGRPRRVVIIRPAVR